eukprot:8807065-Alexandrium_andersonii.AAC.1
MEREVACGVLGPRVQSVIAEELCKRTTGRGDFVDDRMERLREDVDEVLEIVSGALSELPAEGSAKAGAVLAARAKGAS